MIGSWRRAAALAALSLSLPFGAASAVLAQDALPGGSWPAAKCARYKKVYDEAIQRFGKAGLGEAFLRDHDAFLANGCTEKTDVCPRSVEELKLANVLVILSMNQGMSSTFVPFNCRKPPA